MSTTALSRRGREARDWLLGACFPLWSERGVHRNGFLEALDLQHRPIEVAETRVRVQARQTYVFTTALQLGWQPARASDLVALGVEGLASKTRRRDGLFGQNLNLDTGELTGPTADLYDTAFALYALSSVTRLPTGFDCADAAQLAGRVIDETLTAIDAHLATPSGGYLERLPPPEHRLQNPHMHLFEACLSLASGPRPDAHRARAEALHQLCLTRFIDPVTGTLGEHFVSGSWAIPDNKAGEIIEPGHQFEWVWLMHQYAHLTGTELPAEARRLYQFACQTLDQEGRTFQSCKRDGTPVDASRRTWQQTEALKAHVAMWKGGDKAAAARAITTFDILMDEYLTPEGGWIDHYDSDGQVQAIDMPASTGYHVVLALLDLIEAVEA